MGLDVGILQNLSAQDLQALLAENVFNQNIYSVLGGQPKEPGLFEWLGLFL
jgi:hypothetical protein